MRRAVALLFAAVLVAAAPGDASQHHRREGGHVNLVWTDGSDDGSYRSTVEQMPGVSVVSPAWWHLSSVPGELIDRADPALVAWSRERGVAVWPTLSDSGDPDLTYTVIASPQLRTRLVRRVVAALERTGADGVNVGFEQLRAESAPHLSSFVSELNRATKAVVSVNVAPLTDTWDLGAWSYAYERRTLAEAANYLVLLAYDQHHVLRRDGPVAGLDWVEATVEHLLRYIRADRIILGSPLYTRGWVDDPSEPGGVGLDQTLGMTDMAALLEAHEATAVPDPIAGLPRYTYVDHEGREHRVWQEDLDSLRRRVQLAGRKRLGGVAWWRAGLEPPEVWPVVDAALAGIPAPEPDRRSGPPQLLDPVPRPHVAPGEPTEPQERPAERTSESTQGDGSTTTALALAGILSVGAAWVMVRAYR